MLKIKNVKITPEQLGELQYNLRAVSYTLNQDRRPDWEELDFANRKICDCLDALKEIQEKSEAEIFAPI